MSDEKLGAEQGHMKRTAEQVVSEWRSTASTDWGQLVSAINYWAITDMCPALREPGADTGIVAREEALFRAANTAAVNLVTSMNLREHPDSCECYGCGLNRAVVNFALARARENVRPIVERELQAERWPGADTRTTPPPFTVTSGAPPAGTWKSEHPEPPVFLAAAERGTTPPEGLALERAANWFEERGGKWDAEFIATQLRVLAATQRAPVAREGALHDRVVAMRDALKPYLRESLRPVQILAIDVAIQAELEQALADGKEGALFLCRYRDSEGKECGAPIALNVYSYSGFTHTEGSGWLHWASPVRYGPQDSKAVFVKRADGKEGGE